MLETKRNLCVALNDHSRSIDLRWEWATLGTFRCCHSCEQVSERLEKRKW